MQKRNILGMKRIEQIPKEDYFEYRDVVPDNFPINDNSYDEILVNTEIKDGVYENILIKNENADHVIYKRI